MKDRILVCFLAISLLHEVTICKACAIQDGSQGIAVCTVDSVKGSSILLTTSYASVNTCVCTIEAMPGQFIMYYSGQPALSDCGTRIDITNNNGSISTTFQCKQPQLYQTILVSISSGQITLHKQSNSTEDDVRYCLVLTGPEITITCYGTNSPPPITTTTETTSTSTVRRLTTTTTTKAPTTTAIIATPRATTTQLPPTTSTHKSSEVTSKPTTVLTLGTTIHQGDNTNVTVCRKDRDVDIAIIIASTLGVLCVIAVVIIIFFVCRRYIRNASKKQMERNERNTNYANLSNRTEEDSNYADLNNIQIIPVPVESVMYQNVTF